VKTTSIVGQAQTGIAWTGGDSPPSTSPPQVQNGDVFSIVVSYQKFSLNLFPGTGTKAAIGATSTSGGTNWIDVGSHVLTPNINLDQFAYFPTNTYTQNAIGATSTGGGTNWVGSGMSAFNVTQKTQTGVTNIRIAVPMPSLSSVPGTIHVGRMIPGAVKKILGNNSYVTVNNVGGALGAYGLGFFGLKGAYRQYVTKSSSNAAPLVGGVPGTHAPGYFELGSFEIIGPKSLFGLSRIQKRSTLTFAGVSNIQPFATTPRPQFGLSRIRHTTKQLQFGKTNIRSLTSLSEEVVIQSVLEGDTGTSLTEVTAYSSKKIIISTSYGYYQREKKTVLGGQISYIQLVVNNSPLYFLPLYASENEQTIQNENNPFLTTGLSEITAYSSKKVAITTSYGAYHRHKNVVLNINAQAYGAYWRPHTAEYTIAAGVGLPNISGSLALGQALGQLIHFRILRVSKFLATSTDNWIKFKLFPSTYTSWPALSSFSATLSGKTIRGLDSNVYTAKTRNAVRLGVSVVPGGFECDGQTDVSILGSQVTSDTMSITTKTDVAITGSEIFTVGWEGDGVTNVAITAKRIVYGTDFEMDGSTDVQIIPLTSNVDGWNTDCATDCEFTCERDVYVDTIHMDGNTDCEFQTIYVNWAGFINCNGLTSVSILPKEIYTSGNTFNLDGATNVAIAANQAYGFGVEITAIGSASCEFVDAQRVGVSGFECDGKTSWTLDTVADYNINLTMDGSTNVVINAAYRPFVQIVCTGVGDSFIDALIGHFASMDMDGHTDCAPTGRLSAVGKLEWFTGIQTSVSFTAAKSAAAHINCDGSTSVSFNPNQDQFGEIQWGPMDQVVFALGSFVFTDGALNCVTTSSVNFNNKNFILGPDYIFGYIRNTLDTGSPDFVQIPSDSFTLGGKTSRSIGDGVLGARNLKTAVGHTRPVGNYNRMAMRSDLTEEFIRFPLFVDEEIDFPQNSTSIGFTLVGISSLAGYGVIGRDKEKYVTLGILTNTRLTQQALEILATGDPRVDMTQICYEMLMIPNSFDRVSQVAAEVLYLANLGAINGETVEALAAGDGGSAYINGAVVELMGSIKANALISQGTKEVLATGDPEVHVSSANKEVLYQSTVTSFSNVWVDGIVLESIIQPGGNATVDGVTVEIIDNSPGNAVVNGDVIEAIHNNDRHAVINGETVEILNNSTTEAALCQIVAIECLVRSEVDPTVAGAVNNPRYHI
jgi:hypothetical protein